MTKTLKSDNLMATLTISLVVIFGLIPFHAFLSVFFGSHFPDYSLLIKSWKEIILVFGLLVAACCLCFNPPLRTYLKDKLFILIGLYGVLHLAIGAIFFHSFAATAAGLAIDLRYLLFFVLVYLSLRYLPRYRPLFIKVGLAAAVGVVLFGILQITVLPNDFLAHFGYDSSTIEPYLTVDKNPDFIRINSFLRGPNPLGIYAATLLALVISFCLYKKRKATHKYLLPALGLLGVASVAVLYFTYSRSAYLAGLAGGAIVSLPAIAGRRKARWAVLAAIFAGIVTAGLVVQTQPALVDQVVFHNNPSGGSPVDSNEQHSLSLSSSIRSAVTHPLGEGVGSTGSASLLGDKPLIVENQYLFVAHEVGLIGLGLFAAIFGLVLWRLWKNKDDWLSLGVFASGIGIALASLVLPVLADDTVSLVWWGLAAIALAGASAAKKDFHES